MLPCVYFEKKPTSVRQNFKISWMKFGRGVAGHRHVESQILPSQSCRLTASHTQVFWVHRKATGCDDARSLYWKWVNYSVDVYHSGALWRAGPVSAQTGETQLRPPVKLSHKLLIPAVKTAAQVVLCLKKPSWFCWPLALWNLTFVCTLRCVSKQCWVRSEAFQSQ